MCRWFDSTSGHKLFFGIVLELLKVPPKHIAIVMDGNGRWAEMRGLPRLSGHREGLKAIKRVIEACAKNKVEVLSLFAFSQENWQRPDQEVNFLMQLFVQSLNEEVPWLHEHQLNVRFIGDRSAFNEDLRSKMADAEKLTLGNRAMQLVIAINYSGQWDLRQACQHLARKVEEKAIEPHDITEDKISKLLVTGELPAPDLFIRTSGEQRISNFFLWQLAYAELYFCACYWPDFDEAALQQALMWFSKRERRYGKTSEQCC